MGNTLNPYASYLGSQDPLAVIAATSKALQEVITAKLSSGTVDVPRGAGTWTPRQILGHLADTEITFAMRLRQTAAEAHHVIQPFDQDAWNAANPHQDVDLALSLFQAVRRANLAFIQAQPEAMFAKPVTHPERGTMTFGTIVQTMAGHDLNHLAQLSS